MPNYRHLQTPGSTWFFTANLLQRHNNNLLIEEITTLKSCIKKFIVLVRLRFQL